MESFVVMQEMSGRRACVAVRSVAELRWSVMCDFDRALDESGEIRMARVLGQVARAPREIWPLLKFGITSSRAAAALARYLDAYIASWKR